MPGCGAESRSSLSLQPNNKLQRTLPAFASASLSSWCVVKQAMMGL